MHSPQARLLNCHKKRRAENDTANIANVRAFVNRTDRKDLIPQQKKGWHASHFFKKS
jgi:hypothetical protein